VFHEPLFLSPLLRGGIKLLEMCLVWHAPEELVYIQHIHQRHVQIPSYTFSLAKMGSSRFAVGNQRNRLRYSDMQCSLLEFISHKKH